MMNCKVSETAVRSSITTKCADENKMMRQRLDKIRRALNPINDSKFNKENCELVSNKIEASESF